MTNVFLVGAGPGDPDLLTLKAHRLIQQADVILHDSLVDPRTLHIARDDATIIDVGKRCGKHAASQQHICALLVQQARTNRKIIRLKGGDPMVFGRATEEMDALNEAGIAYEIIPGITAATAAAAALQISLTKRGVARSLHVLTGHGAEGGLPAHDWVALTKSGGTLVVYMGAQTLSGLATHFIEAGMTPTMPAIAIENATLPTQRFFSATISTLPSVLPKTAGPVLILIGEAVGVEGKQGQGALPLGTPPRPEALEPMTPGRHVEGVGERLPPRRANPDRIAKAQPLLGVQGAKPPGLTYLQQPPQPPAAGANTCTASQSHPPRTVS